MLVNRRTLHLVALSLGLLFAVSTPITAHAQKESSPARAFAQRRSSNPASNSSAHPAFVATPDKYSKLLQPFLGNCCANSFLPPRRVPPKTKPPLALGYHLLWQEDEAPIPITLPVYIPFAIGYVPEEAGSEQGDDDSASDSSRGWPEPRWLVGYDVDSETSSDDTEGAAETPEQPVVEQPSTVLVFKDGHRADVRNYAILGDALFDFDDERVYRIPLSQLDLAATARTNDARGVDFKLPPGSSTGAAPN